MSRKFCSSRVEIWTVGTAGLPGSGENKKLSCRRETARRFASLNILPSHSRSLKVIQNYTVERACVSRY